MAVPKSVNAAVRQSPSLQDRIENLIRRAPVKTYYDFDIWDKVKASSGQFVVRPGVRRVPLELMSDGTNVTPLAEVFYLVDEDRFYIQWDAPRATTLHYYGPFEGDPVKVLHLPGPDPAEQTREIGARFQGAKEIIGFVQRDVALRAVARDAARAGLATLTKQALAEMTAFTARDEAAHRAARDLAKGGHRTDALEVAKMITSFPERDAAMRELTE